MAVLATISTSARSELGFTLVNSDIALEPAASGSKATLVLQGHGIESGEEITDVIDNDVPEACARSGCRSSSRR